jgi:hypothetical protein
MISSNLNRAGIEINSGIPNFISESVIPINGITIPRYTGYIFLLKSSNPVMQ